MNEQHLQRREDFDVREADGKRYIEGYFAVFDDVYDMGCGFTESVGPHAFDKCLDGDVRVLLNHDTTAVLGRTKAGTATLSVDHHGLYGRVEINPDDTDAVNAWARVKRGDVDQASFGFEIVTETRSETENGVHYRIDEAILHEVSVCTFPAYEGTSLSARSAERAAYEKQKFEEWRKRQKERTEKWH